MSDEKSSIVMQTVMTIGVIASAALGAYATISTNILESEVAKLSAVNEHHLARARFFQNTISKLTSTDERESFLAFLTLWQVYNSDEERRSIILAALDIPNEALIKALVHITNSDNSKEIVSILERAKESGIEGAGIILERIDPKFLQSKVDKLIDSIEFSLNDPKQKEFQSLIYLLQTIPESESMVEVHIDKDPSSELMLNYALYSAANVDPFYDTLKKYQSDSSLLKEVVSLILNSATFNPKDYLLITDILLTYLESDDQDSVVDYSLILSTIQRVDIRFIDGDVKHRLVKFSKKCVKNSTLSSESRSAALNLMSKISLKEAQLISNNLKLESPLDSILEATIDDINDMNKDNSRILKLVDEQFENVQKRKRRSIEND